MHQGLISGMCKITTMQMVPNDMELVPNDMEMVPNDIEVDPTDMQMVPNDIETLHKEHRCVWLRGVCVAARDP